MSLLNRLEAALERLAEEGAERVFGGRLDLVAVGQELLNAAAEGARREAGGLRAPNCHQVRLSLEDFGQVAEAVPSLEARYAGALWRRLREAGYALDSPPGVLITPSELVRVGACEVEAAFVRMAPAFTLTDLGDAAAVYRLTAPATVGRGAGCDLRLANASVSRRHARIDWELNDFVVVDLGSSNGTRVNGLEVAEAQLRPGDGVQLGEVHLRFEPEVGAPTTGDGSPRS